MECGKPKLMKFEWMYFRNCEQIRKQWQVYDIFLFILMSSHGVSIVTETISNTQSEYVDILYQWEGGCLVGNKTVDFFYERGYWLEYLANTCLLTRVLRPILVYWPENSGQYVLIDQSIPRPLWIPSQTELDFTIVSGKEISFRGGARLPRVATIPTTPTPKGTADLWKD